MRLMPDVDFSSQHPFPSLSLSYMLYLFKGKIKRSIFLLKNVLIYRSFDYLRVSTGSIASDLSLDYAARVSRINNAHGTNLHS